MGSGRPYAGRVVFDHLQKTAGQAVNAWLRDTLGNGTVTDNLIGSHRSLLRKYGGEYPVVSGHIFFTFGEVLDPRYQYITLLREPVARAVSWLYFLLNDIPRDEETRQLVDGARQFLETEGQSSTPEFFESITNLYVRHFSAPEVEAGPADAQRLGAALRLLDHYAVVGTFEDMPAFLAGVGALVGAVPPAQLAQVNVTSGKPQRAAVPAWLTSRMQELNALDIELYQTVAARLGAAGPIPAAPVRAASIRYDRPPARSVFTGDVLMGPVSVRMHAAAGNMLSFEVPFFLTRPVEQLEIGIHIVDTDGNLVYGTNSRMLDFPHQQMTPGAYSALFHLLADLAPDTYSAGFAFAERSGQQFRELYWTDTACDFAVKHHATLRSVGRISGMADLAVHALPARDEDAVVDAPRGHIRALSVPPSLPRGSEYTLAVQVSNEGSQAWHAGRFRPVHLSYRWRDRDGNPAAAGAELRTVLPGGCIAAGSSVPAAMVLRAPVLPGRYTLELTLVQELTQWFDDAGFEPTRLDITVE